MRFSRIGVPRHCRKQMIPGLMTRRMILTHCREEFQIVPSFERHFRMCVSTLKKDRAEEIIVRLTDSCVQRKIRLRLHGFRLPKGYTVQLVLDRSTDAARPIRNGPKRRKRGPQSRRAPSPAPSTSDSNPECLEKPAKSTSQTPAINANHSDDGVDLAIRRDNAYPGSSNSIGSIHQRRWWLSLDRENSGFAPKRGTGGSSGVKKTWVRREEDGRLLGFPPFYVRGPDDERSIVTGRLGLDVVSDEKVKGFVPRKGWKPVTK